MTSTHIFNMVCLFAGLSLIAYGIFLLLGLPALPLCAGIALLLIWHAQPYS